MISALLKASNYIEHHLNEPINVAEIARQVGYSQFYFSRVFSETTRMSLYNYIMRRKVSYAYDLLQKDTHKILDIALECGFNSHETFIRAFKRHFNILPSDVRLLNIKKPLQKQEALSQEYIQFLTHLSIKKIDDNILQTHFIGIPVNEMNRCGYYLTALDSGTLINKTYMMQGTLSPDEVILSYPLTLKPLLTLESSEIPFCERFFFEQIENLESPVQHYILTQVDLHSITFYSHNP